MHTAAKVEQCLRRLKAETQKSKNEFRATTTKSTTDCAMMPQSGETEFETVVVEIPEETLKSSPKGVDNFALSNILSTMSSSNNKSTKSNTTKHIRGVLLGVCCTDQLPIVGVEVGVGLGEDVTCKHLYTHTTPLSMPTPATFAFTLSGAKPKALGMPTNASQNGKKYLAEYQNCWPPPWFILLISFIEISVFAFEYTTIELLDDSIFIYRPDRRLEMWRFVSYMVLHVNWFHLGFNIIVQLIFGVPLELSHGSLRVAVIYLSGVLAGSLGTSVVDSEVDLVGASGGVYALLAAHLANVLLNYSQMRNGISQLISVGIFVASDLGYALYCKYSAFPLNRVVGLQSVSYVAHMTGSLAGFTVGLMVLKNFDSRLRMRLIRWLALTIYATFTIFAITFNMINTMTAQMIVEQEGEVIRQHLMHDFGVS